MWEGRGIYADARIGEDENERLERCFRGITMKAEQILAEFVGVDDFGPMTDYVVTELPKDTYECVPISDLSTDNPKGHDLTDSVIWYPKGALDMVRRVRIQVLRHSPRCTIYFLRTAPSMILKLNGPGHSVLNLSRNKLAMKIRMTGGDGDAFRGCKVIIGEGAFAGGVEAVLLNTDLLIKKQSLWSDGILIQGSNQHGIVNRATMELVNYGRNRIILEPHVWIGRRAVLTSGAHIGAGSVVGTAAVATKSYPASCIIAGNPGRIVKRNMTWANALTNVSNVERAIIDQYAPFAIDEPLPSPSWIGKAKAFAQSVWLKAAAAGVAGAAIFEALQELVFAFE
ncbi:acetyltransferase-like isoleucine patch superfamily enzyme [Sphingobium wenxiniae]|nr:hypothetical protein [Sphingobium wenxiniae]MBB6189841.1 acetyltransferase-like isoleucine patch superfamily enzyme [Sphingobium wenxiniae]TWH97836.1 hypothetical protein IQ35_00437 [Sphingobium wenxiniae]